MDDTRRAIIMQGFDLDGDGLEIGPSLSAVAPRREGFRTKIMDHLSETGLRDKYYHHLGVEAIEMVDYIWNGQPYKDLTGGACFDWIIASHVIEHVPDLILFLSECSSILKDGGILSLIVPDKRFCFDCYRPDTGISQLIDAHQSGSQTPSPGAVVEHCLYAALTNGAGMWVPNTNSFPLLLHSYSETIARYSEAKAGKYIDVHSWKFSPQSFRLIVYDLYKLGFVDLVEVRPTHGVGEFFMQMSRSRSEQHLDRQQLAQDALLAQFQR